MSAFIVYLCLCFALLALPCCAKRPVLAEKRGISDWIKAQDNDTDVVMALFIVRRMGWLHRIQDEGSSARSIISDFIAQVRDEIEADVQHFNAKEKERQQQEEQWRIKRYEQMREACDNPNIRWLSNKGRLECCNEALPQYLLNISCDLDDGTPGDYYQYAYTQVDITQLKFLTKNV